MLPVRAARYIVSRQISGPGFNSFGDGGYLEYALPGLKTFQDGRVQAFPPEFFAREVAASESPQAFRSYLENLGARWALTTSTTYALSGNGLLLNPAWGLVYWDDANELYLKRDASEFGSVLKRDEFHYFVPTTTEEELVQLAGTLSASEAERLQQEADRFLLARPHGGAANLARCAAMTRLGAAGARAACDEAAATGRAELVAPARRVPSL